MELPVSTPESCGVPSECLLRIIAGLDTLDTVHGFALLRRGRLLCEACWSPFDAGTGHALYSLTKSFTSVAVGLAEAQGLLNTDDPVMKYFPEYEKCVADPKMFRVRIRHLLSMTGGQTEESVGKLMRSDPDQDWLRGFFSCPLTWEPGRCFAYNSAASYILAALVRRVSGRNTREFLIPLLFQPLGIEPGGWDHSPAGIDCGGWGGHLKLGDLAKFAQLLLNGGKWGDRRILPEDYLKRAVSRQADTSANGGAEGGADWRMGYGYHFWMSRHGFRGDGANGQLAAVIPEYDIAVAATASTGRIARMLEILWEEVPPALSDRPLPENPAAYRRLREKVRRLAIPLPASAAPPRVCSLEGPVEDNPFGIREISVAADEERVTLTVTIRGVSETVAAGFGRRLPGRWRLTDRAAADYSSAAAWESEDLLVIKAECMDDTRRDTYRIDFARRILEMRSTGSLLRNPFPERLSWK